MLGGYKNIQPVFKDENDKYYTFVQKQINKDGTLNYICQNKTKCKASTTKQLDGAYNIKSSHTCQGFTQSQILMKLQIIELENKVIFIL